jgi:hypothetical protein
MTFNGKGQAIYKHENEEEKRGQSETDHGETQRMKVREREFYDRKINTPDKGNK